MPGWSPEVANAFLLLANDQGRSLDQMQLQELVYIAHGWCLAMTGEPLTRDAPQAMAYGHEYRKLAEALAAFGAGAVTQPNGDTDPISDETGASPTSLNEMERKLIASIFSEYGGLSSGQMAILIRGPGSPWEEVYADGSGMNHLLPKNLIRDQFLAFDALFPGSHRPE
jgi:uncharacterized phage-associated protein